MSMMPLISLFQTKLRQSQHDPGPSCSHVWRADAHWGQRQSSGAICCTGGGNSRGGPNKVCRHTLGVLFIISLSFIAKAPSGDQSASFLDGVGGLEGGGGCILLVLLKRDSCNLDWKLLFLWVVVFSCDVVDGSSFPAELIECTGGFGFAKSAAARAILRWWDSYAVCNGN